MLCALDHNSSFVKGSPFGRIELCNLCCGVAQRSCVWVHMESWFQGIGAFGILYFHDDKELHRLMKALYDFCAPGSALALSFFTPPVAGSAVEKMLGMYKSMVTTGLYPRTPDEMAAAIAPWRVTEQAPLENWLDLKHLLQDSNPIREQWSVQGLFAVRD